MHYLETLIGNNHKFHKDRVTLMSFVIIIYGDVTIKKCPLWYLALITTIFLVV